MSVFLELGGFPTSPGDRLALDRVFFDDSRRNGFARIAP
jgi:hypothetical protein